MKVAGGLFKPKGIKNYSKSPRLVLEVTIFQISSDLTLT
jgi:hypothetical protein